MDISMSKRNQKQGFQNGAHRSPIDSAALNAARIAVQEEVRKTQQEMQRKLREEQLYAADRNRREAAAHADRLATEEKRRKLDEEYRRKTLEYQQERARVQNQGDLLNQVCNISRMFGQLWYWEEMIHCQQADIAMKHWQNWIKLRLQALDQAVQQEIAFLKLVESNRHNRQMEAQHWWSLVRDAREKARHNHAVEHREWCYRNAQLVESHRHNVGQLAESVRKNDMQAYNNYLLYLEKIRANDLDAQNKADKNAILMWHYGQLQQIQQQNRWGCKSIIGTIVLCVFILCAFFVALCMFVFINAAGNTPTAQSFNTTCFGSLGVIFLICAILLCIKIRSVINRRDLEQQRQAYLQSLASQSQAAQTNMVAPPPWQMMHPGNPVPPWVWNQGQGTYMPPFPPTQP